MVWMDSIMTGVSLFPLAAILWTVPMMMILLIKYKKVNFVRIVLNYVMVLYFLCVGALVLLPLPTPEEAATLCGHQIGLIPFQFVADIIKESPLQFGNSATYLPALTNHAVLQVIFNVVMMIPFGMFLRYYFGWSGKKVVKATFFFSLFIEITQLTGIYGMYQGSYRLCDVDDLMMNTFGGAIGLRIMEVMERRIPHISAFDLHLVHKKVGSIQYHHNM